MVSQSRRTGCPSCTMAAWKDASGWTPEVCRGQCPSPESSRRGVEMDFAGAKSGPRWRSMRFGLLLRKGLWGEARLRRGLQVVQARHAEEWAIRKYEAGSPHPEIEPRADSGRGKTSQGFHPSPDNEGRTA